MGTSSSVEKQTNQHPTCVLSNSDMQMFLLDLIDKSSFPGAASEFVSAVKNELRNADIIKSNVNQ